MNISFTWLYNFGMTILDMISNIQTFLFQQIEIGSITTTPFNLIFISTGVLLTLSTVKKLVPFL